MEIDAKLLTVLTTFFGIFIPLFALYVFLYFEKRNAINVISHYDNLLKEKLSQRTLDQVTILEPDAHGKIKYTLKFIPYAPILPFAGVLKHLKNALKLSEGFVSKCNENNGYIFEASVQDILDQRDACITFYFMAEMLTCNPFKYRKRYKEWEQDSNYVKRYFTGLIPSLVKIRHGN